MITLLILALLAACFASSPSLDAIARDRKYRSGTGWCFWRWTRVDSEYILRLHVFKTPWFAVCLHWIRKPDAEPWLHDHPVSFLSIILRGGYAEKRWTPKLGEHIKLHSWFNFIRARLDDRHRIILVRPNTLTLCFMGPKVREWGFHIAPQLSERLPWQPTAQLGWLHWKRYYELLRAGHNMRQEPMCARGSGLGQEINKLMERYALVYTAPPVDSDVRQIDMLPPDDFNEDEATWPGDHK